MAKGETSKQPEKPKRPERNPQGERKEGRSAEEQGRQWPADKEDDKGRQGKRPK